ILGGPYVEHCVAVADYAKHCGLSPEAVDAALLHDTVEDTDHTLDILREKGVCTRTLTLVDYLTKTWEDKAFGPDIDVLKKAYYDRILTDPEAVALKILDRAHNMVSFTEVCQLNPSTYKGDHWSAVKWSFRYLKKTAIEFPPLLDVCQYPRAVEIFRNRFDA